MPNWIVPTWMGRELGLLFLARVLMSSSRALAGILVPVYLALLGFSGVTLGVLFLVVALFSALVSSAVGLWSDLVGRRVFLVVIPLLASVAGISFALWRNVAVIFVMAMIGSFGRGAGAGAGAVGPYQPAESAMVTEVTPPDRRNDSFGRLAFGSSLGALGGSVLALLVNGTHLRAGAALAAFRPAFVAAAALAAGAGMVALALHEPARHSRPPGSRARARFPRRSRPLLYRLWVTNGVNGLAAGMFGPFVTYWLFRRFGVGVGEIGLLYAVINLATIPSTLSAAGLARRFGLVRTVTAVRVAQALLLVPMALAPSFVVAGGIYLVRMVTQRIGLPLRQSYVLAMADPAERGSVAALSNLPSQAAMAGSPVLSGFLFDNVSLDLPFELAAVFQLVNAAMFWLFFRRLPPEEERAVVPAVDEPAA